MFRPFHADDPAPRAPRRLAAWPIALRLLDMVYPPAEMALRLQLIVAVYGSRHSRAALLGDLLARAIPLYFQVSSRGISTTLA